MVRTPPASHPQTLLSAHRWETGRRHAGHRRETGRRQKRMRLCGIPLWPSPPLRSLSGVLSGSHLHWPRDHIVPLLVLLPPTVARLSTRFPWFQPPACIFPSHLLTDETSRGAGVHLNFSPWGFSVLLTYSLAHRLPHRVETISEGIFMLMCFQEAHVNR